jgi:hypothetical protein
MRKDQPTLRGQSGGPQFNKNRKKKNKRPKPLLPQVTGIRRTSADDFELVTEDGLVDVGGEYWATENIADELFICLAKREAEPDHVTIPFPDNDICQKNVDLLEQYESSNTLLYKKYIIRAEKLASTYCKDKPNIFAINLSDLDERLQAELLDLQRTNGRYFFYCYDITDPDHPSELSVFERGPREAKTILSLMSKNHKVLDIERHGAPGDKLTSYTIYPAID